MEKITLKTFIISTLFVLVIAFLYLKNKDTSKGVEDNVSDKMLFKKAKQQIDSIKQASMIEDTMMDLVIELTDDHSKHKNIGPKLSDIQIKNAENKLSFELPDSYKLFLKYFGDGAELVYQTSISDVKNFTPLISKYKDIDSEIELDEITINTGALVSLTQNNKQDGDWYWITNEANKDGELPLIYYNPKNKTFSNLIDNFPEWLSILVKSKGNLTNDFNTPKKQAINKASTLNYLE